jgi:antitoxin component of MazEF toxin-antitoxin module
MGMPDRRMRVMVSKVQKWGDGQGLPLSKQVLDLAGIAIGDDVEIIVGERQILVKKVRRSRYDLAELVSRNATGWRANSRRRSKTFLRGAKDDSGRAFAP